MLANILRDLEDESTFVAFVGAHFKDTQQFGDLLECEVVVDEERLKWAHKEYLQGVSEFSIKLASGDPDHYKRSGAMLRALYRIKPITAVEFSPPLEEFDSLFAPIGVSHGDVEHLRSLGKTFSTYHNELLSFSITYNICRMYEEKPVDVSQGYIHTMIVYLASSENLSADSLYMIFKSLMVS